MLQSGARVPVSTLRHARLALLERGELPAGMVHDVLERSWRRSFAAGLSPVGYVESAPHLSASELREVAERQALLVAHARPVIEYLHTQTRDTGSMVILSDERGVVLEAVGDADFLSRAQRVALMPGASWHEAHRGTNAIGTAVAEHAPVVVHGPEHYLERNGFLTCAASPVVAPDGRMLGVLDISGEQRSSHPHTFGLVRAAAQMIENRLFEAAHGDSMRLRIHPLVEGIGTVAEGVLAVSDDGRIVGANQAGIALLALGPLDLGRAPVTEVLDVRLSDLVDWGRRSPGLPLALQRMRGGRLFVRIDPRRSRIHVPVRSVPTVMPQGDDLGALDTGDARMRAAIDRARKILGKPIPLLLQGESGVGKELFANAVHRSGPRRGKPFVAVSCAALPEALIESELFGYAPGAFTGARREGSPGRIREADGGTLFLDEIGDMPLPLQGRLLRVLQERCVTPLGGGRSVPVNFALICATHRDLRRAVEQGEFRGDLYYRINGLALTMPALRERTDFPALVAAIVEDAAPGRGVQLADDVADAFASHSWPGNLRQLHNALATACALLDADERVISWEHLSDDIVADLRQPSAGAALPELAAGGSLRAMSDQVIQRTVTAVDGNISEAARRLGVSRNTLYRRLKRHG